MGDVRPEPTPSPSRSAWAAVQVGAVWTVTAAVAIWAAVRVFGVERGGPAVRLMSFTPYVALAALVPPVIAALAGRWVATGVGALAVVALAACVLPRAIGSPSTQDGVPLTVMAMNMRIGEADADQIVDLVHDHDVDVLTLQEFTVGALDRLVGAGIEKYLPHHTQVVGEGGDGSGLFSRHELAQPGHTVNPVGFSQSFATVVVPGALPVDVHSVHPSPPVRGNVAGWEADLKAQPVGDRRRILAGDFNATLDHAALRRLIRTGYTDAAATVGRGLTPTWPYYGPRVSYIPKITIDHVLVSGGISVRTVTATTVAHTDHRALVAQLVLPRA